MKQKQERWVGACVVYSISYHFNFTWNLYKVNTVMHLSASVFNLIILYIYLHFLFECHRKISPNPLVNNTGTFTSGFTTTSSSWLLFYLLPAEGLIQQA